MPKDDEIPLIIGRPILLKSRCNFELRNDRLNLRVYDDELTLNMLEIRKHEDEKIKSLSSNDQNVC